MALTRYEEGSLKELSSIAFPLMITAFSVMFMLFIDRMMLAHYSLEAHNAAVRASTLGWAFLFGAMSLAGIAEVFVAQFNGANQKLRLGEPVWQMIWLSLLSSLVFIPLSLWGAPLIFPKDPLERQYFQWMMLLAPAFPFYGALAAFFIGQGKTFLTTILAVVANLINALLDYALIFGVEGYIPSFGIVGAAVATFGGTIFQALVLLAVFLNRENRLNHITGNFRLNLPLFKQCMRIGIPGSLFCFIEILGFAAFYWMMSIVDDESYLTITGICQSIMILFFFFGDGVMKAVITIAGNLIGAKRSELIAKVLMAGTKLHVVFLGAMLAFFFAAPNFLISFFLPDIDNLSPAFVRSLQLCACMIIFYLFLEGIRLMFWGLLTAAGDTFFLLVAGTSSVWAFMVAPVYLLVVRGGGSVELAIAISLFYSLMTCFLYLSRFWVGKWKKIQLIA
jgi:MATE family multidrug resistance protein